ncbi:MAG: hypothetical protein J6O04_09675 [Selenomonadaceae bacterium]|nr:hypothetical protein [Selenomonadaceae bacterium]
MSRKSKQERLRELEAERARYIRDYKMELRRANETMNLIHEVEDTMKALKRGGFI